MRGEWILRSRARRVRAAAALVSVTAVASFGLAAPAVASVTTLRTLTYHGERFEVPESWPVDDLAASPSTCVLFDRHAVYEGQAGPDPVCPASGLAAVTEAVQVAPLGALGQAGPDLRSTTLDGQSAAVNTDRAVSHRLVAAFPGAGVLVTVSYGDDPALAEQILDSFRATGPARDAARTTIPPARSLPAASRETAGDPVATVGPVPVLGEGFDTCEAPSSAAMAAWRATSSYRTIGVYIGGADAACPPGNLSASWVTEEANAGWHFVPLYVGLQAPCANQGGMQPIQPSHAAAEGTASAEDAVSEAEYFAMGRGSPLFYDMEAWNTEDSSCSSAVVTFVKAWTDELHALGYQSGIYGSADAGIKQDIAPLYGHAGAPDVLYFADWDGQATTSSGYIPAGAWPGATRIKQYGNVTQTFGGVTLNIDQDYVDADVVGDAQPSVASINPSSAPVGVTLTVTGSGFVAGRTTVTFGGVAASDVAVASPSVLTARVPARAIDDVAVQVTTPGGTSGGDGADRFRYVPIAAAATNRATGGYWLASAAGNVYNYDVPFDGSAARVHLPAPIVGMAEDPRTGGYWLVTSRGNIYNFDAPFYGSMAAKTIPAPVVGIAATSTGYVLTTSRGNVYGFNTPFQGSVAARSIPSPVVGLAAMGLGYSLTTAAGNVYNFDAPFHGSEARASLPSPVVGITADPSTGGYWLTTAAGNVYNFDAPFYGSAARHPTVAPVVGLASTRTGYVLSSEAGEVEAFATDFHGSLSVG